MLCIYFLVAFSFQNGLWILSVPKREREWAGELLINWRKIFCWTLFLGEHLLEFPNQEFPNYLWCQFGSYENGGSDGLNHATLPTKLGPSVVIGGFFFIIVIFLIWQISFSFVFKKCWLSVLIIRYIFIQIWMGTTEGLLYSYLQLLRKDFTTALWKYKEGVFPFI